MRPLRRLLLRASAAHAQRPAGRHTPAMAAAGQGQGAPPPAMCVLTPAAPAREGEGTPEDGQREAASFHRRPLPASCIDLTGKEGQTMLQEALNEGHAESFLAVMSQFSTQSEPAFCALGTLTTALNALGHDPMHTWKGPWRWFADELLTCCQPLDKVSAQGMTIGDVACLAMCNRVAVDLWQPPPLDGEAPLASGSATALLHKPSDCCERSPDGGSLTTHDRFATVDHFRDTLVRAVSTWHDVPPEEKSVIVASYGRKVLGQTGDGHFSPLAAYHAATDRALILDVARFKYPPHWVSLPLLFTAMRAVDASTGGPRGYLRLRAVR